MKRRAMKSFPLSQTRQGKVQSITRVFDRETGNWIMAARGLGMHCTEAAGDLLIDPEYSQVLPEAVRSGSKNAQIIVKTTVISGHTGAPQVVAVYTW